MASLGERIKNSWNAFMGRDPTFQPKIYGGNYTRPDRPRFSISNARSVLASIYNRIAVDVSSIDIRHVRLNEDGLYSQTIDDELNWVLSRVANVDQTSRAFIQDVVMSMFDEGSVAIIPTDTSENPNKTESYKIFKIRTAKIVEWYPEHIRVQFYREQTGQKEELIVAKSWVPIIENPFYSTMNEPNSTLQRLLRAINQLDSTNRVNSTGQLDLIVQVPYSIKSQAQRAYAKQRKADIEAQLTGGSELGIAYIDGTEHVIQLNRSLENNIWNQVKELTSELYNELGLTQSILDGTADQKAVLNYYDRTVTPIITAIVEAMEMKWLSKTAITQKQAIRFFRDPFKLVPVGELAEMADKLTRNEIMSSNEIRSAIGLRLSDDPRANLLLNKNLNYGNEYMYGMNALSNEEIDEEVSEILKELRTKFSK